MKTFDTQKVMLSIICKIWLPEPCFPLTEEIGNQPRAIFDPQMCGFNGRRALVMSLQSNSSPDRCQWDKKTALGSHLKRRIIV